ncbi:hypothetical protein QUA70_19715 [Microcoleus sp. LAD1_D5]|uniref:hypothetical protein n=1 Tax=Microcoleus sp. LAD1_D5 TaxID=2818813 RepID=UPI002FD2FDBB
MLIPLSIDNFWFDEDGNHSQDSLSFTFTRDFLIDRFDSSENLWIRFGDGKPKYYYWSREKEIKADCYFAAPSEFWADWEKDYNQNQKYYRSTYGADDFQDFLRNCCPEEDFTLEQLIADLLVTDLLVAEIP